DPIAAVFQLYGLGGQKGRREGRRRHLRGDLKSGGPCFVRAGGAENQGGEEDCSGRRHGGLRGRTNYRRENPGKQGNPPSAWNAPTCCMENCSVTGSNTGVSETSSVDD